MDLTNFVATVILITASGALAPGPLFFITISQGAKTGAKTGLVFSIAHTLIEFTLIMLFALGLLSVVNQLPIKITIGVPGGIVLLIFGIKQVRDSLKFKIKKKAKSRNITTRNLLLLGLTFTGLNPFFILWWLTVGANLILLSLEFASLAGVVFMYICHVWIDYVWLISVAHFAKMGANVIGFKWYRLVLAVFGVVLIYFGISFLINSLKPLI